jgi:hypothetical protein
MAGSDRSIDRQIRRPRRRFRRSAADITELQRQVRDKGGKVVKNELARRSVFLVDAAADSQRIEH